jgi:hypothetical protein
MKEKLSLILFIVYVFLLLLAVFSLGVPPHDLPLFGGMFAVACVGWVLRYRHSRRWNVIWAIACIIAVIGAILEIVAGRCLAQQRSESQSGNPRRGMSFSLIAGNACDCPRHYAKLNVDDLRKTLAGCHPRERADQPQP